jgi:hypothetical protein
MGDDDEILQVKQRTVPAGAPIHVPAGAMSSPFAMARQYLGNRPELDQEDTQPPADPPVKEERPAMKETPARRGRGPGLVTRAKETLKACGPLGIEQFAEGLGIDVKTAHTLARNGVQRKLWKREQHDDGEKLVLLSPRASKPKKAGQSGLKHYLTKKAGPAPTKAPARKRKASAPAPAPAPAPTTPARLPVAQTMASRAQFGLFNTGEFHIVYDGQEMKLPREVTRDMVAYLDKIAGAMQE